MSRSGTGWDDHVFHHAAVDESSPQYCSTDTNARAKPVRSSAGKRQYDPYLEKPETAPTRSFLFKIIVFIYMSCLLSNCLQQKKEGSDCISCFWTYCVCELPFFSYTFCPSLCSESITFKYAQVKSDEDSDGCAWIGVPIGEYRGRKLYQGAVKDNSYFAVGACALMRSSETGSEPYIGRIIR
jgi:hypothetical protein